MKKRFKSQGNAYISIDRYCLRISRNRHGTYSCKTHRMNSSTNKVTAASLKRLAHYLSERQPEIHIDLGSVEFVLEQLPVFSFTEYQATFAPNTLLVCSDEGLTEAEQYGGKTAEDK